MKDTKKVLLALLTAGLVGTWVYHLYDKSVYSNRKPEVISIDPETVAKKIQDSLQLIYFTTLDSLGTQLDSAKNSAGLLQGELAARMNEINRLKSEIANLLKKENIKKEDLDLAGKKTTEFQQLVAGLPKKNNPAAEKKQAVMLTNVKTNSESGPDSNLQEEKTSTSAVFKASDLKFTPIKLLNDMEVETNKADDAGKLVISFAVKNNAVSFDNAEVFAVITQPDGKVMQTDVWETAYISTHDFGKKMYTWKVRFEYQKGETKYLQLTLKPEDYEKGNYRLQVFHNGYLIGETFRTLN